METPTIHKFLVTLCLGCGLLLQGVVLGDDIKQTASDGGITVAHTGKGNVRIGFTQEEYEAGLKAREKEVKERLEKAHKKENAQERKLYETELKGIQQRLQDSKLSYREHIKDLRKRIEQLESIRGQVPDEVLAQAQAALARGDAEQADALLKRIVDQEAATIKVVGEATYQRCQIALDAIRYQEAIVHCQRAVQLVPDNATYLSGVGELTHILGHYRLARDYHQKALASNLKTYGEGHPNVARDRNNLGLAWNALGKYQIAIGYFEQALASDLKTYGEDHPDVARDRNNLGDVWRILAKYQTAIGYYEQALASDLKTYGEEHPNVATDRNNLGLAWNALGKYQTAIGYFEQALASDLKTYGEGYPNVATDRNNLGLAWNALGKYQTAIGYFEQALASDLKTYGEEHPNVATDRNNLGDVWRTSGKYQTAIGYYKQALASDLKTYGEDHPSVARDRNNLGLAWQALSAYQRAIGYFEQALASDLKTYGEGHPNVARDRNNLGLAWASLREYWKAIRYFEQALVSDLKTYGEGHPNVARDRNNLGSAWASLGEHQKAIRYFEQALASDLKTYGEEHPSVARDRRNLGLAWNARDDYPKATKYFEQALASDLKTYGEDHPLVARDRNNLRRASKAQRKKQKEMDEQPAALVMPSDRVNGRLNVRDGPSTTAAIVGKLRPGEEAIFLESVPRWYKIQLDNGQEGFVSKSWSVKLDSQPDEQYIRLGAWNIKKLGHGGRKNYPLVRQIIDDSFDIVAIVEVMQKQRAHPGYDALMQTLGNGWEGLVTGTPRPNTGSGSAEFYAIVYRKDTVRPCTNWTSLQYYQDNDGGDQGTGPDLFSREPAYACFEAGFDSGAVGVDFMLAAYHATWSDGNEDEIVEEVSNLDGVFTAMGQAQPGEADLMIIGDFNLIPTILHGAVSGADRTKGSGSTLNSNGDRTGNLYDHVLVHDETATSEMVWNAVVLNRIGLASSRKTFYQTVSDHLPVMVRVRSSGPDDD